MKQIVNTRYAVRMAALMAIMWAAARSAAASPAPSFLADDPDTIAVNPCLIGSYPYVMDFDNDTALQCVMFFNANGDNVEWQVVADQGVDSSRCAKISYASPNDDYILLPRIAAPGVYAVEWTVKVHNSWYGESYEVLLGDSILESETVSLTTFHTLADTFRVADGDTLGVSFRCVSDDRYALYLDDLTIHYLGPLPDPCTTVVVADTVVACREYHWRDTRFEHSGLYADTLAEAAGEGCDSVFTLLLTIEQPFVDTLQAVACQQYSWRGRELQVSGLYADTAAGPSACDSLLYLSLVIGYPYYDTTVVCAVDSFEWHGLTFTQSGLYNDHHTTAEGCDSVETLVLIITHGSSSIADGERDGLLPRLYPNPTTGRVTLDGVAAGSEAVLYDLTGRQLSRGVVTAMNASLDLGTLPAGFYLLRLTGPRGAATLRVEKR